MLIKGQWYRVKDTVKTDGTLGRPIKYCGTVEYKGETNHDFWEPRFRLHYFISPDEVEPLPDSDFV
jgi:hypothetical protein